MAIKYSVVDHHSMWGWAPANATQEEADIIFTWNDFEMKSQVARWKERGKKVIVFEHGWDSFTDYDINNKPHLADGYMALGENTKKSLMNGGVGEDKILVTGNKNFDNLKCEEIERERPRVLYTTLHWFESRRDFNNRKLKSIIDTLGDTCDIHVKTMTNSKVDILQGVKGEWFTNIYENRTLFSEIAEKLSEYDIILTPKESTFDFTALLVGKKVFRIAEQEEYRSQTDPRSRNILPFSEISVELLSKDMEILVDIKDELSKSLEIEDVLEWVSTCI